MKCWPAENQHNPKPGLVKPGVKIVNVNYIQLITLEFYLYLLIEKYQTAFLEICA